MASHDPLLLYVPARLRDGLDAEEKGKRVAERAAPGVDPAKVPVLSGLRADGGRRGAAVRREFVDDGTRACVRTDTRADL
jgi:hypothetical protein